MKLTRSVKNSLPRNTHFKLSLVFQMSIEEKRKAKEWLDNNKIIGGNDRDMFNPKTDFEKRKLYLRQEAPFRPKSSPVSEL